MDPNQPVDDKIYCTCGIKENGPMVGCDNPNCPVQWYHYVCVGYKEDESKSNELWYCCEKCRLEAAKLDKEKDKDKDKEIEDYLNTYFNYFMFILNKDKLVILLPE